MKRQKVNIKHLCEETGFSAATISNVLNKKKGVNHETATKVLRIARDMGYFEANRIDRKSVV